MFKELFTEASMFKITDKLGDEIYRITGKSPRVRKDNVIIAGKGTRGWKTKKLDIVYKAAEALGADIHGMNFGGAVTLWFTYEGTLYHISGYGPDGIIISDSHKKIVGGDIFDVSTEDEFFKAEGY